MKTRTDVWSKRKKYPKAVEIRLHTSKGGPCPICAAAAKAYSREIPFGMTIEEVLGPDWEPPYHPNCRCEAIIEYYDESAYLTEERWKNEIKPGIDAIFVKYVEARGTLGPVDNLIGGYAAIEQLYDQVIEQYIPPTAALRIASELREILSPKEERIHNIIAKFKRSCAEWAENVRHDFEVYFRSRGVESCSARIDSIGPFHAWVVVDFRYLTSNGDVVDGSTRYDPWLPSAYIWNTVKEDVRTRLAEVLRNEGM